jgi:amidase
MADAHRLEPQEWSNVLAAIPPALRVVSGDTFVTETLDAAGVDARGQERARPPNPMNGPIFVEGAEPGDALRVEIIRIDPVRGTGWTRGALSANVVDPEAVRELPPRCWAPADHDVRPSITMQLVRAGPAINPVIAAPAKDDVVPCSRSAGCTGCVRRSREACPNYLDSTVGRRALLVYGRAARLDRRGRHGEQIRGTSECTLLRESLISSSST